MLMLGQELWLLDLLISNPPPVHNQARSEYVQEMIACLEEAHMLLREQQLAVKQDDSEEPSLFQTGNLVLVQDAEGREF